MKNIFHPFSLAEKKCRQLIFMFQAKIARFLIFMSLSLVVGFSSEFVLIGSSYSGNVVGNPVGNHWKLVGILADNFLNFFGKFDETLVRL